MDSESALATIFTLFPSTPPEFIICRPFGDGPSDLCEVRCHCRFCQFLKIHLSELPVKLYLGQNEDHSLRDSISDSSDKLLQRGSGGKVSIYVTLVKGEYMQSSTYFCRRLLLVMRSRCHHEGF